MAPKKKPPAAVKASAKLPRFSLELDARTNSIPDEALECREINHSWSRVPSTEDRRALLAGEGMTETIRVCTRCATQRHELYFLPSFEAVRPPIYIWSEGYLINRKYAGHGRLSKTEVKKAMFARHNSDLIDAVTLYDVTLAA